MIDATDADMSRRRTSEAGPSRTSEISRRRALQFLAVAGTVTTTAACGREDDAFPAPAAPTTAGATAHTRTPDDAWHTLIAGNARFVTGKARHPHTSVERRESLVDGQAPIACVLGCADSRVPPELVFDRGLGDTFTVRSAGEVLDEAVVGSIEYSVAHLAVPLVVVLGHSGCGAVTAAIDAVRGDGHARGDIAALVHAIEPAVRSMRGDPDDGAFLSACVEEQARQVATQLAQRSSIIRSAVERQETRVVTAVYDLASGRVVPVGHLDQLARHASGQPRP